MKSHDLHNIDHCRSYASEAGLMKALEKYGIADHLYVIVKNRQDRFTAIFNFSNITDGNVMRYAHLGFMTIG